jgi:hypothetical protein
MQTINRWAITAFAAVAMLTLAAAPAAADRSLGIAPESVTNRGRISATYNDGMRTGIINCNISIVLAYVRSISKAGAGRLPEGRIGTMSARTGGCREMMTNWTVTFLNEIDMRYEAFLGTLPRITGLLITGLEVGVRIDSRNANCLFRGDLPFLVFEVGGGQRFNRKTFLANTLPRIGGAECPLGSTLEISGTLEIDPPITVSLL